MRCAGAIGWSMLVALSCGLGCNVDVEQEGCDLTAPREDFAPVSSMLGTHCGSLDCHGQLGRPLRLYNGRGLRLDPDDLSGHGGTRSAEHEANLRAVVGLEPELTCAVLDARGRDPARLSLVRKASGTEHHEGGVVLRSGADGMNCLLGWLSGEVDQAECERAAETERPK
jgi:hypothetical protein